MTLTLSEITPIGLCISTQELLDAKRFQANFCDNLLLRRKLSKIGPKLTMLKRELNSTMTQGKFLDGHKTAIISNIDKILGIVTSRYYQSNLKAVDKINEDGQELIDKIIFSNSFEEIAALEPVFKTKITFPVYELFVNSMKKSNIQVI